MTPGQPIVTVTRTCSRCDRAASIMLDGAEAGREAIYTFWPEGWRWVSVDGQHRMVEICGECADALDAALVDWRVDGDDSDA